MSPSLEWLSLGNCTGMGADWHDLHPDRQKDICWSGRRGEGECPVWRNCYAYSQTTYETWAFGTWGGLKASERQALGFFGERLPPHPGRAAAPTGAGAAETVEVTPVKESR